MCQDPGSARRRPISIFPLRFALQLAIGSLLGALLGCGVGEYNRLLNVRSEKAREAAKFNELYAPSRSKARRSQFASRRSSEAR